MELIGQNGNLAWPECDFRRTPLSASTQKQFAGIYEYVLKTGTVPQSKAGFLTKTLSEHVYDHERGLYLPIASTVYLDRKLPDLSLSYQAIPSSAPMSPVEACYYTNTLTIPPAYDEDYFRAYDAAAPTLRLTNAGLLFVTLEQDPESLVEFEEIVAWTRGKDDDFGNSAFAQVDKRLCEFTDYRGYCIVFSGRNSLHFHFMFDTRHLVNCPWDAKAEDRQAGQGSRDAALMAHAHEAYWDSVAAVFSETIESNIPFDRKLRPATQWRRMPWGVRTLDKDAPFLGLPVGSRVPQIVLHEDIRSRAPRDATRHCVPETFSVSYPTARPSKSGNPNPPVVGDVAPMLADLVEACRAEWGEYPCLVSMKPQNGEWLFNFKNREDDNKPSTYVLGEYRKLQINGRNSFTREFYLPDNMTANEWGDYLSEKYGEKPVNAKLDGIASTGAATKAEGFRGYKERRKRPFPVQFGQAFSAMFAQPIAGSVAEMQESYRGKLGPLLVQARALNAPMIVKSVEGVGKTSALRGILANDALDEAMVATGGKRRFSAFAFRSREQAQLRATEFTDKGVPMLVMLPFWEHLEASCEEVGVQRLTKDDFASSSLIGVLAEVKRRDVRVFALLEERRRRLWDDCKFDPGLTLLAMTHKAAELFPITHATRVWYHPDFDPNGDERQEQALKDQFLLREVVFDDPEIDEFLYVLPEMQFNNISALQTKHKDWRHLSRFERHDIYYDNYRYINVRNFEEFNALMRCPLDGFTRIAVDYNRVPYGQDNRTAKGIYRSKDGEIFQVRVKPWLWELDGVRCTFLTTEEAVSRVIEKAYENIGKRPVLLELDQLPGVFPISVPMVLDKRASAKHIDELAAEIVGEDPDAIVIADGVDDVERVMTFQKMKGLNDLHDKNVHVIITWMNPDKYAALNVIGQWAANEDILLNYHQDQLNQAIGRNKGYRDNDEKHKAVVITSSGIERKVITQMMELCPRVQVFVSSKWR